MPRLLENVVYVQIRRGWLSIELLGWSGKRGEWSGPAQVALVSDRKGQLVARTSSEANLLEINPGVPFTAFSHPRVLIHDFDKTELLVRHLLRKTGFKKGLLRTTFVVQVMDQWEGGLTDIEFRAVIELFRRMGAGRVLPIEAFRPLTPPELVFLVGGHRGTPVRCPIPIDLPEIG